MSTVRKIFQTIADVMCYIAMGTIVLLIVLNGYEIFSRFLFKKSNYWIQDVTTLLMVWFVFPGMVKVIWEKKDILIDLLLKSLPPTGQKVLHIIVHSIIIVFTALMSISTYRYLMLVYTATSITARIPMYLFTGMILLGFVLFLAMYVFDLIVLLTNQKEYEGLGGRSI